MRMAVVQADLTSCHWQGVYGIGWALDKKRCQVSYEANQTKVFPWHLLQGPGHHHNMITIARLTSSRLYFDLAQLVADVLGDNAGLPQNCHLTHCMNSSRATIGGQRPRSHRFG